MAEQSPTEPGSSTLSVVIPLFNQAGEIGATIAALDTAVAASGFETVLLVVDDGSTDGSAAAARAAAGRTPLVVVEQDNRGRFEARRRGLEDAQGEYCLLIDSRVAIDPGALRFVEQQLAEAPGREIWNAHVEIETDGNPFGVFWDVLTRRAFRAYFGSPRTTSFGLEEFERFPKGTTCFFAPTVLLTEAFDAYRSGYSDVRHANDDTPVIRWLAARQRINISPSFACRYEARSRLAPFLRHAFHRGTVFVDGHGRRQSRWFPLVVGFYPLTVGWLVLATWAPVVLAAPVAAAVVGGAGLAVSERRGRDALTMAWVTPLYAAAHAAGMWRGLALLARNRLALRT